LAVSVRAIVRPATEEVDEAGERVVDAVDELLDRVAALDRALDEVRGGPPGLLGDPRHLVATWSRTSVDAVVEVERELDAELLADAANASAPSGQVPALGGPASSSSASASQSIASGSSGNATSLPIAGALEQERAEVLAELGGQRRRDVGEERARSDPRLRQRGLRQLGAGVPLELADATARSSPAARSCGPRARGARESSRAACGSRELADLGPQRFASRPPSIAVRPPKPAERRRRRRRGFGRVLLTALAPSGRPRNFATPRRREGAHVDHALAFWTSRELVAGVELGALSSWLGMTRPFAPEERRSAAAPTSPGAAGRSSRCRSGSSPRRSRRRASR
jgi:hypothetical protein